MDGVHEMAAQIFVQIVAARAARGESSSADASETARASYIYAKAFFEEHGRHLERGT